MAALTILIHWCWHSVASFFALFSSLQLPLRTELGDDRCAVSKSFAEAQAWFGDFLMDGMGWKGKE